MCRCLGIMLLSVFESVVLVGVWVSWCTVLDCVGVLVCVGVCVCVVCVGVWVIDFVLVWVDVGVWVNVTSR